MTRWLATLLLVYSSLFLFNSAGSSNPANVQEAQIEDLGVSYHFGEDFTFTAKVTSPESINEILLILSPAGQPASMQRLAFSTSGEVSQTLAAVPLNIRPFSDISYRYQLNLKNGQSVVSPSFTFRYIDNRVEWSSQEESDFQVYWYNRDSTFGQVVINVAREGLQQARTILPENPPSPIRIYVYTSRSDLQSAWSSNNQPWVAGYAEPDLGQVLISIPTGPEQQLELERQVPHEILHILQYQMVGNQYIQQPTWLMEGMASLAELYPNPEYQRILIASVNNNELLPINSLCQTFPREVSGAFKAYAESESFVRFLYQKYGSSGLEKLVGEYQNGLGCEEGVLSAYGVSLSQLEYRWKQESLGVDVSGLVVGNLMPYMLLLVFITLPILLVLFLPAFLRKKDSLPAPR